MKRLQEILSAVAVIAGCLFAAFGTSWALWGYLPWWVSIWGVVGTMSFVSYWLVDLINRRG